MFSVLRCVAAIAQLGLSEVLQASGAAWVQPDHSLIAA